MPDADVAAMLTAPHYRRCSYAYGEEVCGEAAGGRTLQVVDAEGSRPANVITMTPYCRRRLRRLGDRKASR